MMSSSATRANLRNLVTTTTDPIRAAENMLEAAKNSIKMTKRTTALNLLKGLRVRRLGTYSVEKASKDLTKEIERNEGVVMKLMYIVVGASELKMKVARKRAFKSKKEVIEMLPAGWRRNEFQRIVNKEVEQVWKDQKEKNEKKKNNLEAKHKVRKEKSVYKGVPISDEQLEAEFGAEESVNEVLGYGVELNDDEKEFLKLPKSATDYVEVDEEKIKTSVKGMAAKLRRSIGEQEEKGGRLEGDEVVSQGMDVQNGSGDVPAQGLSVQNKDAIFESKRVYNSEKGVDDFKKKVVTSMVTCKRIMVPEAAEVQK